MGEWALLKNFVELKSFVYWTNSQEISVQSRAIEWSLREFESMRAVHLFLRARAVIKFALRAACTLENA